jgi:hypothetical protein
MGIERVRGIREFGCLDGRFTCLKRFKHLKKKEN